MPTVSEAVVQTLVEYGTEKFFCFMGGDHELWYALHDAGIQIVNCRSEAGAVYMADGYGRVSGKPGFVYGQRGPGVANVAGSLADAVWASSPVVSLTSSISSASRDRFEYQELDGIKMHVGFTDWNKEIHVPQRAAAMTRAAIRVAAGPSPKPVHLEIPAEMFGVEAGSDPIYREANAGSVTSRRIPPQAGAMRAVIDRLLKAERPLILAGKGTVISEAWEELTRFADALSIPVATTLGGKGAISENHELAVGVIGRNSRLVANDTIRQADFILVIGSRLGGLASHRWTLPFAKIALAQIDTNQDVLGHNFQAQLTLMADAKLALESGLAEIEAGKLRRPRTAWSKKITQDVVEWSKKAAAQAEETPADGIHPADVVARLRKVMGPQDLLGADTGAIGSWGGALFPVEAGKTFVRANGSLGWVVPGVMGAALARPQHRAVALTGDGGLLYHIAELETALRLELPVVIVALNNSCLASEYHAQLHRRNGEVVSEVLDYRDTDFAAVARAFGAHGARVTDRAHIQDAISDALASKMPALVDIVTSKEAVSPSGNHDKTRKV
ncbi:MAG TPA: thiamine pyrophosphate-binding protein [Alphaproteobacteria bacterium]|jgi:acetolactate synthase-1/2/3 large subunit